jgi:hypothetical protein
LSESEYEGGAKSSALFIARTKRGGGNAVPGYAHRHTGPAIVAGNAWCLHDDLKAARAIVGDAPVIAVNGAAREVKAIALFSYHPQRFIERGCEWIRHQRRLFGNDFTVHAARYDTGMPYVQHWWEDARGGGGSAWGARKLAWLMGFDPVVFVGCPLTPGNYAGDRPGMNMTRDDCIAPYRAAIAADTEWHQGVHSMSGWTREFFGCL